MTARRAWHRPIVIVTLNELRSMWRDGRLWAMGCTLAVLLAALTVSAALSERRASHERAVVARATLAQWNQQGDKNPHRGAHFGLYAFRTPSALAVMESGLLPFTGQAIWLEPHRRNLARFTQAADQTPVMRLADTGPGFVLNALLPLLIIGLAFNAVSREREAGTLRMLHCAGVSGVPFLAGKWLGVLAAVGIVLLPCAVTSTAALAIAGPIDTDSAARAALLAAAYLVYYAVIAALTVAVSAVVSASRTALFALMGVWIAFVIVVPRLSAAAADRWVALPASTDFWHAITTDYQQGLGDDGDLAARGKAYDAQLLRDHGVARLADLPVGAAALRRLHRDAYANRVHALHFERLWARYDRQEQLMTAMALLSPSLAMRSIAMHLAGTDLAHQRHFEDHAERYRQQVSTHIDGWDSQATRGMASYDDKYGHDALWQSIPPFRYDAPSVRFALRAAAADLAVLVAWACVALGLLGLSVGKVRP